MASQSVLAPERPLEAVTDTAWRAYYKRNRALRHAWENYRPYLLARDARGAKRREFIFAWAAAERALRKKLMVSIQRLGRACDAEAQRVLNEFNTMTGQVFLDGGIDNGRGIDETGTADETHRTP